jgi:hypothetical protein
VTATPAPSQGIAAVGAGVYAARGDGVAALLKVSIEADATPNLALPVTSLCPKTHHGLGVDCGSNQYLYARTEAVAAIATNPKGPTISYADVRFYPKENQVYFPVPSGTENVLVSELEFVPVQIGRDIALDEWLKLSISIAALAVKYWIPVPANFSFFFQATLDIPGYKTVRYVSAGQPFDGVRVVGFEPQVGFAWTGTPDVTMHLSLGGSVDYSRWAIGQSDAVLAAMATADVGTFLRLFVQPQFVRQWESAHGWVRNSEIMGGFGLVF